MIHPCLPLRSLLLPVLAALAFSAGDAAAQMEFAGIPWGTPRDEATTRIQATGHVLRGQDQHGDVVFGAADSVELVAMFDSAGLVSVLAVWSRDPDRLPALYRRMADSMRAVLSPPDGEGEPDEFESWVEWSDDDAATLLMLRPRDGGLDSLVVLRHRGPGHQAEDERRRAAFEARWERERAEGTGDTTALGDYNIAYSDGAVLVGVDTVKFQRLGAGMYGARFLYDWMLDRRLPNGMLYNAWLVEVELDCAAFRSRPLRNTPLYYGVVAIIDVPEAERVWTAPARGSPDDLALRSACEALGRQP